MKTALDTQKRLECALAGALVLRTRATSGINKKLSPLEFAREIGMLGARESWHDWHGHVLKQVIELIKLAAFHCSQPTHLAFLDMQSLRPWPPVPVQPVVAPSVQP